MNSFLSHAFNPVFRFLRLTTLSLVILVCLLLSTAGHAQLPRETDAVPSPSVTPGPEAEFAYDSIVNSASEPLIDGPRSAERRQARSVMSNPRNPLLEVQTSEGDLYLELFQDAAPRNVALIVELAQTPQTAPAEFRQRGAFQAQDQEPAYYYDGLTFHNVAADTFIELGFPASASADSDNVGNMRNDNSRDNNFQARNSRAASTQRERSVVSVVDEINARGLGLEQQRLLDEAGRPHPWLNLADETDFQRRVLAPLYRTMSINDSAQLQNQLGAVLRRLQQMNLMQVYENMGYRYNGQLPSRRPVSGSVLISNTGPGTNNGDLIITLADTPWLTGTHTVVGQIISGQSIATLISRQPATSVRVERLRYAEEPN